jgi:predicted transcriptional regulator
MSIIRTIHNRENPFVMINKAALWDQGLSLEAVGLWARLLSRPDNWETKVTELTKSCKIGQKKCYALLKELIDNGYAYRRQINGKGGFKCWETHVFEFKVSKEEIKEMFTLGSLAQAPTALSANEDATNTECTNSSSLRSEDKEEYKEAPASPPPSADASALFDLFLQKIRERNPKFKEPNKLKWVKEFDLLLRVDKREVEEVKNLILWAATHKWYRTACLSPAKLRKDFDVMTMQKEGEKEQDLVKRNRAYALKIKEKYPEQMKGLTFDDKFAMNRSTAKEIPFNLPEEIFKKTLVQMFGGSHGR